MKFTESSKRCAGHNLGGDYYNFSQTFRGCESGGIAVETLVRFDGQEQTHATDSQLEQALNLLLAAEYPAATYRVEPDGEIFPPKEYGFAMPKLRAAIAKGQSLYDARRSEAESTARRAAYTHHRPDEWQKYYHYPERERPGDSGSACSECGS